MLSVGAAVPRWGSMDWRWAIIAGVPVACYIISRRRGAAEDRTDFDGFLKVVEPIGSTGSRSAPAKSSTSIEDFYKDAGDKADTRDPLDFDSFLHSNAGASNGQKLAAKPPQSAKAEAKGPGPNMIPVTVLYGTEYGFSKEIAEKLCTILLACGLLWPRLENMADFPEGYDFSKVQVALVACSTQGDGVPPTEARGFCDWLFAGKAGGLEQLKFAVCALGDKSYTHFCRCGKLLDAAFEKAGAQRLLERVDVNKEDWPVVDSWLAAVVSAVKSSELKSFAELGLAVSDSAADAEKAAAPKKWGKNRPYPATVLALEGLCDVSGADDKNTIRMELDLGDSGLAYLPGDALGLYPTNDPKAVNELLDAMGASAADEVGRPAWHYEADGDAGNTVALGEALAKCYDIRSPKPELLKLLVGALDALANGAVANGNGHGVAASPPPQQQLRAALVDSVALDAYLAPRHVVDVLQDALPAKLSATQVLSCLRQLQPRLYSISSAPLEDPRRVQVTVAEVKYLSLGKPRIGVCSTMLSERLQVGSRVPVHVHKNPDFRLPPNAATPIIMVGPGTGLAPFRSFIMQRLLETQQSGDTTAPGRMVLYFGCRRRDQDYLYGQLLEDWSADGRITLFTAFSREQKQKVYVQNRLAESADMVWDLLQQGGHFYVCGDAGSMAGAVENALLELIEQGQGQGRDAAQGYLQNLSAAGRYQRDVWY